MSAEAIRLASRIYEVADRQHSEIHPVRDDLTTRFFRSARQAKRQWAGVAETDEEVHQLTGRLLWLANTLAGAPISLADEEIAREVDLNRLTVDLQRMQMAFPTEFTNAPEILSILVQLRSAQIPPMARQTSALLKAPESVAILTRRPRFNKKVETLLRGLSSEAEFVLLRDTDLRKPAFYDRLILIGPPRWLDERVLLSVRAPERHFVFLDCFWGPEAQRSVLPKEWSIARSKRGPIEEYAPSSSDVDPTAADLDDVMTQAQLNTIRHLHHAQPSDASPIVDALAFRLVSGKVLLLAADGKVFALEEGDEGYEVVHCDVDELQDGQFIVLRTVRDRELISELADLLLGQPSLVLRKMQTLWKEGLRRTVTLHGLERSVELLRRSGMGTLATQNNLRRWMGPNFIHNQSYGKWEILMRFVGLESKAKQLWDDMDTIYKAHRRAGYVLSDAIARVMSETELNDVYDEMLLPPIEELGNERLMIFQIESGLGLFSDARQHDLNHPINL